MGPVQVAYGSDPAKTQVVDLAKYIDRENKRVRSITGQIETDYGKGVYRVDSPLAQAAAGFLKDAGSQHLADVDIICRNKYATIVVVPLDGKPIRESGKVLIQVGTVCRPVGWITVPARARINGKQSDCFRIVSRGKDQLQVENTDVTVSVANAGSPRPCSWTSMAWPADTGRIEAVGRQGDGRSARQFHVRRTTITVRSLEIL